MEELKNGPKKLVALDQSVLFISDLHCPYNHPDSFEFLKAIKHHFKPDITVNVGDEVDGHSISFHDSDTSLPSADQELEMAIRDMEELKGIFPKMYILESNHGSLAYRKVKHHGIPIRHLKDLHELYNTPEWSWHHEVVLETHNGFVTVVHGKTGAYNKLALEQGNSAVQGHYHQKFEITWVQSSMNTRFNMIVGCLIDQRSMAFAYGKNISKKPILGCGWLNELGEPALIRMKLDRHGRWNGKL